ncbi:MAG: hypothetical protein AAB518_00225, partial [Patescibacteria group bacterium]
MKKTIIISVVSILAIVALFFGVRYFRNSSTIDPGNPPPPTTGHLFRTPVLDKSVVSFWAKGEAVYLVSEDGLISKFEGESETPISDQPVPDLASALPSPDRNRVLVAFGSRTAPAFSIFDISADQWTPLPAGTVSAAWSPSGTEVAYLTESTSNLTLATMVVATSKKTELMRLSGGDFSLAWVVPKKIYLKNKPSARYPVELWSFDIAKRALDPLLLSEPGLDMKWSPSG